HRLLDKIIVATSAQLPYEAITMAPAPRELTPAESAKVAHERRTYNLARAGFAVSVLALIGSITSPIVTYYWFQGDFRIRELKLKGLTAEGNIDEQLLFCNNKLNKRTTYYLTLFNSGDLPIDKIRLTVGDPPSAVFSGLTLDYLRPGIYIYP